MAVDVFPGGVLVVRLLPQPPVPRRRAAAEGAIDLDQHRDKVAAEFDGAEHVGFAEVEIRVPDPAEKRPAILEDDRPDRRFGGVGELEPVPEHESHPRRGHRLLNARERPALEKRRRRWRGVAGKSRDRIHSNVVELHGRAPFRLQTSGRRDAHTASRSAEKCTNAIHHSSRRIVMR